MMCHRLLLCLLLTLAASCNGSSDDPAPADTDTPAPGPMPVEWTCDSEPTILRSRDDGTADWREVPDWIAIGDPAVVQAPDGTYHLYYTCAGWLPGIQTIRTRVCLSTSSDGIAWVKHSADGDPAIVFEGSGEGWDANNVETVDVIVVEGTFYLYYLGSNLKDPDEMIDCTIDGATTPLRAIECWSADKPGGNLKYTFASLGVATSTDGINWTRPLDGGLKKAPLLTLPECPHRDCLGMEGPTVLKEDGRPWRMWYGAHGAVGDKELFSVGYAESSDGLNWARTGTEEPILTGRGDGFWDNNHLHDPNVVRHEDGNLYLFYAAGDDDMTQDEIDDLEEPPITTAGQIHMGLAVSSDDGVTFTRVQEDAIISAGDVPWAAFRFSYPAFIAMPDEYVIFTHGIDKNAATMEYWEVGRCTAPRD